MAHRFAYELLIGPIPSGLTIDHLCRNTGCVNPAHMEPVTRAENARRHVPHRPAHCVKGHEFTPENTYSPPKAPGSRQCKTCNRERQRMYDAAKRERGRLPAT